MVRRLFLPAAEAGRAITRMAPASKKALRQALETLRQEGPDAEGLDVKALSPPAGMAPVYRLRVGTWRVAFRMRGADIEVVHIFPRKDGYGWMERL